MHRTLAISAVNRLAELPRVAEAVGAFLANARVPWETIETVHLVVDELFSNIVHWAHQDGQEHAVRVRVALETDGVRLTVEDDGRAFDPLSAPAPDFHVPAVHRKEGGLGLHLVRTLAKRLTYERVGGRNVVQATIANVAGDFAAHARCTGEGAAGKAHSTRRAGTDRSGTQTRSYPEKRDDERNDN